MTPSGIENSTVTKCLDPSPRLASVSVEGFVSVHFCLHFGVRRVLFNSCVDARRRKGGYHAVVREIEHLKVVRAELVRSRSGPGGGYSLALPVKKISILDVVNAVSPLERIRECPLGLKSHTSLCPLHKELDRAYAATERAFAGVTLDQLLKSSSKIVALCEV